MAEQAPESEPSGQRAVLGVAVLIGAVTLALGVTLYLLIGGGDDPASPDGVPTPVPGLPGAPTPPAGTGMLEPHRPEVGQAAPNFALPDVRDPAAVRQLTDYRGKVVVLNFWATWCGPCKREMPEFERAQEALGDAVVVLAVNYRESPDKAAVFLEDLEVNFPSLVDGSGKVAEHYRVSGLPVTFFLDADGVVRHIEIGEVSVEELERYLTDSGAPYLSTN